jgi:hypothetical protein
MVADDPSRISTQSLGGMMLGLAAEMNGLDMARRRMLQAGVAAAALLLPGVRARLWAQSDGALKLLRSPKLALVFGNGKYSDAPLKNSVNDARAMGDALVRIGFEVTEKLDATRAEMTAAIRAYTRSLAARKCVGVFFYAGHGVQVAWTNYMVPVDAAIDRLEDVPRQAVAVTTLVSGLTRAANPMNVIILDACRDNPFGGDKTARPRGLSQMDAPPSTLLAYATSPGNVASDGEGTNGLYTEHLLRELAVKEARIEDVFKRVRLGVRRKSNGLQIPWESTSLEEDFYFLPSEQLKKLSDEEKQRLFKAELALWKSIQESQDPAPLEAYLRRHPSGDFAELAQLQLDRVLARGGERRIQIASQVGNPFTKGSAFARIARVGDTISYRQVDPRSGAEQRRYTTTVTQVTDTEVVHSNGLVSDLLGNQRRTRDGFVFSPNQLAPSEFAVGKRWRTQFEVTDRKGVTWHSEQEIRITARERVTVPAGSFNAFRLEGRGRAANPAGVTETEIRRWHVPAFQWPVAREEVRRRGGKVLLAQRLEMVSYKLA